MSWKELLDGVVKALRDKIPEIILGLTIASLTYLWTVARKWFQQGNARDRQVVLSLEANRLVKLQETLAQTSDPSPKVTGAQAAVRDQLNQVLENLSHLLTEPEVSVSHSPAMAWLGKYLLLYRATGIIGILMHTVFYFLVFVWLLFVYVGWFEVKDTTVFINFVVSAALLTPVVLWNYLTRKVDARLRLRQAGARQPTITVPSK